MSSCGTSRTAEVSSASLNREEVGEIKKSRHVWLTFGVTGSQWWETRKGALVPCVAVPLPLLLTHQWPPWPTA